uniref:ATP-binding protein n=1 Tax=Halarcobacter sp. TaxID=2321133 RepID=UPI003A947C56
IPQNIIDRVFEPYFTTKQQGEGTGMGLYMSKMIIEDNMGGKLKIENENDGVLITIDLKGKVV